MKTGSHWFVWLLMLAGAVGFAAWLARPAARGDDAAQRRAEEEGAAAMRRVVALWNGGQRDAAWFLYQDATRTVNADLRLMRPRNVQLAELRRFAAETIGAQPALANDKERTNRRRQWTSG